MLAHSAVIIPAGGRFSAKTFWKDACQYKATFYTAVPTMHQVFFILGSRFCHLILLNRQRAFWLKLSWYGLAEMLLLHQ